MREKRPQYRTGSVSNTMETSRDLQSRSREVGECKVTKKRYQVEGKFWLN